MQTYNCYPWLNQPQNAHPLSQQSLQFGAVTGIADNLVGIFTLNLHANSYKDLLSIPFYVGHSQIYDPETADANDAHPVANEAQNTVQDDQPSKTAASPALPSVGSATNDNYISEAASLVPGPSPDSSTNISTNSSPAGDTTEQTTVSVTIEADADAEHEDEFTTATAVEVGAKVVIRSERVEILDP
ncbi:hypothetical protein LTR02_017613 [Friedmanniomyces endolithicus]|nr:hypothetical protein LTR02_017613 [Friedmanniomyces endolithicus]